MRGFGSSVAGVYSALTSLDLYHCKVLLGLLLIVYSTLPFKAMRNGEYVRIYSVYQTQWDRNVRFVWNTCEKERIASATVTVRRRFVELVTLPNNTWCDCHPHLACLCTTGIGMSVGRLERENRGRSGVRN